MTSEGRNKAIFLDRDGVLNVDLGYTYKPTDNLEVAHSRIQKLSSFKPVQRSGAKRHAPVFL